MFIASSMSCNRMKSKTPAASPLVIWSSSGLPRHRSMTSRMSLPNCSCVPLNILSPFPRRAASNKIPKIPYFAIVNFSTLRTIMCAE